MKKIGTLLAAFIIGFIVYLIIAGSFDFEELLAGAIVSLIFSLLIFNIFTIELKYLNPIRLFWFIVYIPYFLWMMVKANLSIAYVVLKPSLPISPGIARGKTTLKSPLGKLLLTSSITLTPGTLSVDILDDEVFIHCVTLENENAEEIMRPFEKYIKRITE